MSVKLMSDVFHADPEHLSSSEKLVMLALADYANDDGRSIYPSITTLRWKTALSDRSIQRILSGLRDLGLILITKEARAQSTTEYAIDVGALAAITLEKCPFTIPPTERGDTVPPLGNKGERGDTVSPEGCQRVTGGVTPCRGRGDTVSPNTPCNPSEHPSEHPPVPGVRAKATNTMESQLARISEAHQLTTKFLSLLPPKHLATSQSIKPFILQLLKKGITCEEINTTLDWLFGPNAESERPFVVLGGRALVFKWDNVQAAMARASRPLPTMGKSINFNALTKDQRDIAYAMDESYQRITGASALQKMAAAAVLLDRYFVGHTKDGGKLEEWPRLFGGGVWKLMDLFLDYVDRTCAKWERMPPGELFVGSKTWAGYTKHELKRSGMEIPIHEAD